jgi:hypothetical protein
MVLRKDRKPFLPGLDLVERTSDADQLGKRYLLLTPDEDDPLKLNRFIFGDLSDPVSALKMLEGKIKAEWAEEDVLELDGWLVSRSEARMLALASMW